MLFVTQITLCGMEMCRVWAVSPLVHGIWHHCSDPARGKELVVFFGTHLKGLVALVPRRQPLA